MMIIMTLVAIFVTVPQNVVLLIMSFKKIVLRGMFGPN
jgi:hypothetical protein